ncbi:MAG: cupin domain-containing protein [Myxococcota bacterium]|nr:cupin domain-containing protein [Myxococcota bacterium]
MTDRGGYALPRDGGREILFRGTRMHVKVGHAEGGAYSLIEMAHPANVGPALHRHSGGDEAFYVLDGEYEVRCGNEVFIGTAGSFVFVPRGAPHGYTVGRDGGRVLVVTPAGLERYFAEVADRLAQGPVSMDVEAEIAARYGQDFLDRLHHWGQ